MKQKFLHLSHGARSASRNDAFDSVRFDDTLLKGIKFYLFYCLSIQKRTKLILLRKYRHRISLYSAVVGRNSFYTVFSLVFVSMAFLNSIDKSHTG